jgi:hypothetical protein
MDKLWYPVAFSALIMGCGGDVDTSGSTSSGGSAGVDAGTPTATGGTTSRIAVPYGPVPFPNGVSGSAYGGSSSLGSQTFTSTAPIDAGLPSSTGGYPTIVYGII